MFTLTATKMVLVDIFMLIIWIVAVMYQPGKFSMSVLVIGYLGGWMAHFVRDTEFLKRGKQ